MYQRICIVLMVLLFLFSCQENEDMVGPPSRILDTFGNLTSDIDGALLISPSGDLTGLTDWDNIMAAIQSRLGSGEVANIQLAEGIFYICKPLAVQGFNGTIEGAGKDQTVIKPAKGPDGSGFDVVYYWMWDMEAASIFYFDHPSGKVELRDFTILIDELNITKPWSGGQLTDIMEAVGFYLKEDCNTRIEGIRLKGIPRAVPGDYHFASPMVGIRVTGEFDLATGSANYHGGTHILKRSELNTVGTSSYLTAGLENASITVGGKAGDSNIFENCYYGPCPWAVHGSTVLISFNEMHNMHWNGIYLSNADYEGPYGPPSKAVIENNTIHCVDMADAIALIDEWPVWYGLEPTWQNLELRLNKFPSGSENVGGILAYGIRNAKIALNEFQAPGYAALYSYYFENSVINGLAIKNMDQISFAPVYFGRGTKECKLFGAGLQYKVYDRSDNPATPEYDGDNYLWNVNMTRDDMPDMLKQQIINKTRNRGKDAFADHLEKVISQ